MTKRMTNLLVLMMFSALAACSGPAPTSPSEPAAMSDDSGGASATSVSTGNCDAVVGIDLKVDDSSRAVLWVEATYEFISRRRTTCPAPRWSSDRDDLVVDRENPFRAGFPRSGTGTAILTAVALNGVTRSIRLDLGTGSPCRNIVGVDLRARSDDGGLVWILATYRTLPGTSGTCSYPPEFSASREGLRIDPNDPFRAFIREAPAFDTTVVAAAPNGVQGVIVF